MADDKKTYLINIESNLKKYADEAAEAKKKVDELKTANDLLKKSGQENTAEYQLGIAAQKQAQKEYAQTLRNINVLSSANKANATTRDKLNAVVTIETQKLKALGDGYTINSDGLKKVNPLYIQQKKNVADANLAIINYDQSLNKGGTNVGRYGASVKAAIGEAASSMFAFAAPVAVAAAALNGLKDAFAATEAGAKLLGRAKTQLAAFFENIVTGNFKYAFGNQLPKDIRAAADLIDEIRIGDRKDMVEEARMEKAGKDTLEQKRLLILAEEKENELIAYKTKDKEQELSAVRLLLEKQSTNTDLLNRQAQLEAEILNIKGERSLRIASKLAAIEEKEIAAAEKRKKELEDQKKKDFEDEQDRIKEAQKALQKEVDDYKKAQDERRKQDAIAEKEAQDFIDREIARMKEVELANAETKLATRETSNEWLYNIERDRLDLEYSKEVENAERIGADVNLINEKYAAIRKQLDIAENDAKLSLYADFAGNLSKIFGENTAIGKAAAIAETTINTYRSATAAYAALAGVPVVGPILGVAAAGAAVAAGIASVKKIIEVKVPGGGGGGSVPTAISASIPAQRTSASPVGSTILTQQQLAQSQLNSLPNQNLLTADDIARALMNMPAPVVTVEDINARTKSVNKVVVRANI
jgi:hypothetical protein